MDKVKMYTNAVYYQCTRQDRRWHWEGPEAPFRFLLYQLVQSEESSIVIESLKIRHEPVVYLKAKKLFLSP